MEESNMKQELVFVFGDRNVIMRTNDIADIACQPWFREFVGLSNKADLTNISQETLDKLAEAERDAEAKANALTDAEMYDYTEPAPMPIQQDIPTEPEFRPEPQNPPYSDSTRY